jgi:DNA-binding response OmpR family regulator
LRREQFAVHAVADGVEAQELASNQNYDLVILDLTPPGAPGLDVLRGFAPSSRTFQYSSLRARQRWRNGFVAWMLAPMTMS